MSTVPRLEKQIRESRVSLQNPWAYLDGDGKFDALAPQCAPAALIETHALLGGKIRGRRFSKQEIGQIVYSLHKEMWKRRAEIFGTDDVDPFEIVDPILALELVGYEVALHESLGLHAFGKDSFEVAGIMDRDQGQVKISRRFLPPMRDFTAPHELAHAILHNGSGLHRDRAPDGSGIGPREAQEMEADIFAALFLLPAKLVRAAFSRRFLAVPFRLTEATAFALGTNSPQQLHGRGRSRRDLARLLAGSRGYDSRHFSSLAERFGVSVEVMAIRLEELNLIGGCSLG